MVNKKQRIKNANKLRRQKRIRVKLVGTSTKPRMSVFRSLDHLYIQLIDDSKGNTLVSAKDFEIKEGKNKTEKAALLGKLLAQKALDKGIKEVVFDKGSYKYHGRVKAAADGAREAGLKI